MNNLQPGQQQPPTPQPALSPALFGKLGGHDSSSPFDIADHEEIHSFTKVCEYFQLIEGSFYLNEIALFVSENNHSHSIADRPQV